MKSEPKNHHPKIPSHDMIGCGLAFLDDIRCFVILSWVCHSKKLTSPNFTQFSIICNDILHGGPSFLRDANAELAGNQEMFFFWNQIVLLKTRCPKNPDPSKVPILRTWTPALQVQTLPCTEASGCCPCSTMISTDVIERCLYDGSHPDDQLLTIQHPSYKWVLHTLTIFLAICECHPSLNLMKQQVLLVPATSVKKSNLIKKASETFLHWILYNMHSMCMSIYRRLD